MGFEFFKGMPRHLIWEIANNLDNPEDVKHFSIAEKAIHKHMIDEKDIRISYKQKSAPLNQLALLKKQIDVANLYINEGHLPPKFYYLTPLWIDIRHLTNEQCNEIINIAKNNEQLPTFPSQDFLSLKDLYDLTDISDPDRMSQLENKFCSRLYNILKDKFDAQNFMETVNLLNKALNAKSYHAIETRFSLQKTRVPDYQATASPLSRPTPAELYDLITYIICNDFLMDQLMELVGNGDDITLMRVICALSNKESLNLAPILQFTTITQLPPEVLALPTPDEWTTIIKTYPAFENKLKSYYTVAPGMLVFYQDEIPQKSEKNYLEKFIDLYIKHIINDTTLQFYTPEDEALSESSYSDYSDMETDSSSISKLSF